MRSLLSPLKFKFIDAVDGATLRPHPTLTRGEYGCFKSHANVLAAIATGPHDVVLVLEDDAVISVPAIKDALGLVSSLTYDAFVLGVNYPIQDFVAVHEGVVQPRDSTLYGMHAVMYTKEGARRLSAAIEREGVQVPVDTFLARQPNVYVAQPSLVSQAQIKDSDTQKIR
jgi:GR25 family glycosyltransferase involved in LPS biosynthesis